MKTIIKVKKEIEIKTLLLNAQVRYWKDSIINGENDTPNGDNIPCKENDSWCPEIDIDSGKILNWEIGKEADLHYKVCDCCSWDILDENDNIVFSKQGQYVPDTLCPKEKGYGDYIIMEIDPQGYIKDWDFKIKDFK